MLNIILRRNEDGTIKLREDADDKIDVDMRNHILNCSGTMSSQLTAMSGNMHPMNFSLLQQEAINGNWKISLYHIYEWDDSILFGEKTMAYKDMNVVSGK